MKVIITSLISTACLSSLASAATLSGSNLINGDGSDLAVVDNTGQAIAVGTGIAAGGYFRTLSDAEVTTASYSALVADFEVVTSDDFSGFGTAGLYSFDSGATTFSGAVGTTFYTFFGNSTDLASATQFGLYKSNEQIDVDSVATPDSNNLFFPQSATAGPPARPAGEEIFGSSATHGNVQVDATGVGLGNPFTTASFTLVSVPEPSSTALLGLGGLAFVLRRRR